MQMQDAVAIIQDYALGNLLLAPEAIIGGRLHQLSKIETRCGKFSIKKLAIKDAAELAQFRKAERITAALQQQGLAVVTAMRVNDAAIYATSHGYYLVYPWIEGSTVSPQAITATHAYQIGSLLAQIHQAKVESSFLSVTRYATIAAQRWQHLAHQINQQHLIFAAEFNDLRESLMQMDAVAAQAFQQLTMDLVVSHGDIDPYNVVWQDPRTPVIIDWELVSLQNPEVDFAATLLYWMLVSPQQLAVERIYAFCRGYKDQGGIIQQIAIAIPIVLGQWLNWFEFNVNRACHGEVTESLKKLSLNEAQKTLSTLSFIQNQLPCIVTAVANSFHA